MEAALFDLDKLVCDIGLAVGTVWDDHHHDVEILQIQKKYRIKLKKKKTILIKL